MIKKIFCLVAILTVLCSTQLWKGSATAESTTQQSSNSTSTTLYPSPHQRFGYMIPHYWNEPQKFALHRVEQLHAGWHSSYYPIKVPPSGPGMEYVQMIRVGEKDYNPATFATKLAPIVDANPGSLWLIGNEQDRLQYQDSRTPEDYAEIYHTLYTFLKQRDPSCKIAIGGIVQPTPLRLEYLDRVLTHYRQKYGTMIPVDVWNIHNMILNEQRTGWGAGIPVGITAEEGVRRAVTDTDSIEIFKEQLVDFRQWMANQGERNKPLIISEYGILMPSSYGFPPESVAAFMNATFDYMLSATDENLGYPEDGNRLVQRWAWYSLNEYAFEVNHIVGSNGNLFDPESYQITFVGRAYQKYTAPDLIITDMMVDKNNVEVVVKNVGLSPVNADVTLKISNSEGDLYQNPVTITVMPEITQTITVTLSASADLKYLKSSIDTENTLFEKDETNNEFVIFIKKYLPIMLR